MADVSLELVTKQFDGFLAVKNVNWQLHEGEITSLLGPSGCGKTTTMRLIAGLDKPTSGRILFDGRDVTDLGPEKRNVAMVTQFPIYYSSLSAYDNAAFALRIQGLPENKIRQTIEEMFTMFDMSPNLFSKNPKEMTIPERQKLMIIHALVRNANVYLLDEPVTVFDPRTRAQMIRSLTDLQREKKRTTVYVTHDQSEAMTVGDYITVMKDGKFMEEGKPSDLYYDPKTTFVGWFLGSPGMNFLDATYSDENGGTLDLGGLELDVSHLQSDIKKRVTNRKLTLGIRPEQVQISLKEQNKWTQAEAEWVERRGGYNITSLRWGNRSVLVRTSLPVQTEQKIWLRFPKEHARIFDRDTGDLIARTG